MVRGRRNCLADRRRRQKGSSRLVAQHQHAAALLDADQALEEARAQQVGARGAGRHDHRLHPGHVDRAEADRLEHDRAGEDGSVGGVHPPPRLGGIDRDAEARRGLGGQRHHGRAGVDHHFDVLAFDQRRGAILAAGVGGDPRLAIAGGGLGDGDRLDGDGLGGAERAAGALVTARPSIWARKEGAMKAIVRALIAKMMAFFSMVGGHGAARRQPRRLLRQPARPAPRSR